MNKKKEFDPKTIKRLIHYIADGHKLKFFASLFCVILNSIVAIFASLFIKELIDNYIAPLLVSETPDFTPLLYLIIKMAIIFGVGIIASFVSNMEFVISTFSVYWKEYLPEKCIFSNSMLLL